MDKPKHKLLKAVEELAEAIKCEHKWRRISTKEDNWEIRHCRKCGLRETSINVQPAPRGHREEIR